MASKHCSRTQACSTGTTQVGQRSQIHTESEQNCSACVAVSKAWLGGSCLHSWIETPTSLYSSPRGNAQPAGQPPTLVLAGSHAHVCCGTGAQQCWTVKRECCDMGSVSWQGGGAAYSCGSPFLLSVEGTLPRFTLVLATSCVCSCVL